MINVFNGFVVWVMPKKLSTISLMFSSTNFIILTCIRSEVNFSVEYKIRVRVFVSPNEQPIILAAFVKKTTLSPSDSLGTSVRNQLGIHVWVYICPRVSMAVPMPIAQGTTTNYMKSRNKPMCLFFKIVLANTLCISI